jgi:hypothetical protein
LNCANEQLAGQLKEAHEALFEVQTAVQATPVHKRKEQRHILSRLSDAEQVCLAWAYQLASAAAATAAGRHARLCRQTT